MASMLVHDTRLSGSAPPIAENTYKVNGGVAVKHAFGWIAHYAKSQGGLSDLFIMCHGLEGLVYDASTGECAGSLGFGLQLCREGFNWDTIYASAALEGWVETITIYACGPANTRKGFQNTAADGLRFCAEVAAITNAEVVAAVETQWYSKERSRSFLKRLFGFGPQDVINFGAWEGSVYRFSPDGAIGRIRP